MFPASSYMLVTKLGRQIVMLVAASAEVEQQRGFDGDLMGSPSTF